MLTTNLNEEIRIEVTVPVVVTPQARKVLSQTDYSEDEFLAWAVKQITFGGANVIGFLEAMTDSEVSD